MWGGGYCARGVGAAPHSESAPGGALHKPVVFLVVFLRHDPVAAAMLGFLDGGMRTREQMFKIAALAVLRDADAHRERHTLAGAKLGVVNGSAQAFGYLLG